MPRDHIIPRFILKGFAINPNANKDKQEIMIYDKASSTILTKKIVDAYAIRNFNSPETEKYLANEYENDVARIFQRIKLAASEQKTSIELTNAEYKLLFRFFTIMWRRNEIQVDKANEVLHGIDSFLATILGNDLNDRLRPEFRGKSLDELFDQTKDSWIKPFYDHVISTTNDTDPTVLKTIKNYKPTIIHNTSNIHFLLHNTYGTLNYYVPKGHEVSEFDCPFTMIEPISSTLCFCLMICKDEIELDKEKYQIKIETWDKDKDIERFFINPYMTKVAKSYVVDDTNMKYVNNNGDNK